VMSRGTEDQRSQSGDKKNKGARRGGGGGVLKHAKIFLVRDQRFFEQGNYIKKTRVDLLHQRRKTREKKELPRASEGGCRGTGTNSLVLEKKRIEINRTEKESPLP